MLKDKRIHQSKIWQIMEKTERLLNSLSNSAKKAMANWLLTIEQY